MNAEQVEEIAQQIRAHAANIVANQVRVGLVLAQSRVTNSPQLMRDWVAELRKVQDFEPVQLSRAEAEMLMRLAMSRWNWIHPTDVNLADPVANQILDLTLAIHTRDAAPPSQPT